MPGLHDGGVSLTGTVYALKDPGTDEVRYVGSTTQDPRARLYGHMKRAMGTDAEEGRWRNVEKEEWLAGLDSEGTLPGVIVVEDDVPEDRLEEVEESWCELLLSGGVDLLNRFYGRSPSPRTRKRMSESAKARAPNRRGEKLSESAKEKLRENTVIQWWVRPTLSSLCRMVGEEEPEGFNHFAYSLDAHKNILAEARRGSMRSMSPEERSRVARSWWENSSEEERRRRMQKLWDAHDEGSVEKMRVTKEVNGWGAKPTYRELAGLVGEGWGNVHHCRRVVP